jgi:hypothetical protein
MKIEFSVKLNSDGWEAIHKMCMYVGGIEDRDTCDKYITCIKCPFEGKKYCINGYGTVKGLDIITAHRMLGAMAYMLASNS